jgi:hypothetical protein
MPTEKASGQRKPQQAGAPPEGLVMLLAASVIMLGHGVILKGFSKNAADVYMVRVPLAMEKRVCMYP